MIYETNINPGDGLGSFVRLGESMSSVVDQLTKFNYKLKVMYSDKNFLSVPIMVEIVEVGIRLTFLNRHHQVLKLIELMHLNSKSSKPIRFMYNGVNLNEFEARDSDASSTVSSDSSKLAQSIISTGPTLKGIYNKIYGPTYPGELHDNVYIISYPGILFKFTLKDETRERVTNLPKQEVLLILLNLDQDIFCDAIALYKGDTWDGYDSDDVETSEPIDKLEVNLDSGEVNIIFTNRDTKTLKIGETTQQQTLNIMGPPDDYFNKFDSRLLIHKHAHIKNNDDDISQYKFHNYFKYGIDILYELNNHAQKRTTIKKIIIHNGGITESLNLIKWNRCNWEIKNKLISFNSKMVFDDLPLGLQKLSPVILNRNESEFVDNDLDIINHPKKQNSPSITSTEQKVKTWGQSKLYGFDRCIFEVLDSNGTITTITIY